MHAGDGGCVVLFREETNNNILLNLTLLSSMLKESHIFQKQFNFTF